MNPQIRTGLTHLGTAVGGMVAATAFLAQHSVDLYAMWDQLNSIVAAITKLIAMFTPLATAAFGIYKASTNQKLLDVIKDPKAPEAAAAMPITPQATAVADALKGTAK